jgi:hypothetical protein
MEPVEAMRLGFSGGKGVCVSRIASFNLFPPLQVAMNSWTTNGSLILILRR